MSMVDVATLKARAEEFVAKAIAGEATLIEQASALCLLISVFATPPGPRKLGVCRSRLSLIV